MKVERSMISGQSRRQRGDLVEGPRRRRGAGHAAQDVRVAVLERDVEIGQDETVGHQRDQLAHMG